MLKVVIVEDEKDVRERIAYMLEHIDIDVLITHTYENGIDAYHGIINDPPDILITDIHIPYINGIELIRLVKDVDPFMRVVIITGYDEVDYTKQAIELDVIGYISKPTRIKELNRIMNKAANKISEEYKIYDQLNELNRFKKENLPFVRENALIRLLGMHHLPENIHQKLISLDIHLESPYLMVGVFDSDRDIDELNLEEFHMALLSLKENIAENCPYDHELFVRNDQLIIFLFGEEPFNTTDLEKTFNFQLKRIQRFSKFELSLGFSEVAQPEFDFKTLYQQATKALEMRHVMGGNGIYYYENLSTSRKFNYTIDDTTLKHLIYLIKYKPIKDVWQYLEDLRQLVVQPNYQASYNLHVTSILNTILNACDDISRLYQEYMDCKEIYLKLSMLKTNDETFAFFKTIIHEIRSINDRIIGGTIDQNLKQILNYLEANYTDESINLSTVSEKVNLSPGYISSLLKKEFNMTFVKYLTMMRMEKAAELLSNPQLKIIDVGEQVGYSDPYYFSHCFKKYFNVSPKEYRNLEKTKS